MSNRFFTWNEYLKSENSSFAIKRKPVAKAATKKAGCKQVSEDAIGSDEFVVDILEFFFEERLTVAQLNDPLRDVAAQAVWKATEGSKALDLVPRPPGGRPGIGWLVSQAVQIAFRKAQNQCIYEIIRVTVKLSLRSEYEIAKLTGSTQSRAVRSFSKSMVLSDAAVDLIKQFEGFVPNLYNDPVGHCTIGYGTLVHKGNCNGSEPDEFKSGISEQKARELLKSEAKTMGDTINSEVKVALNQNQFDALTSFIYNIGTGAFKQSTLLKKLNEGDYTAVPVEMKKWVKASGQTLPGLVRRRDAEAELFQRTDTATSKGLSERPWTRGRSYQMQAINWCQIRQDIVRIAIQEEGVWTNAQGGKLLETQPAMLAELERYWRAVPNINAHQAAVDSANETAGSLGENWSAAFISSVFNDAGVLPAHGFPFSLRHLTYIVAALRNRENSDRARPFWLYDNIEILIEAFPQPGDLICYNRSNSGHSYSSLRNRFWGNNDDPRGSSHCDIVVAVTDRNGMKIIETIGGNVGDTVSFTFLNIQGNVIRKVDRDGSNPRVENNIFGIIKLIECS